MRLSPLHLLVWLLFAACGDDGGTGNTVDASPPVDARILNDAARQACSATMTCSEQAYQRVCDSSRGFCVECLGVDDCAGDDALGPQCQTRDNTCQCSVDDDCQSNIGGGYCHPIASACGCLTKDDCPADSECEIEPYLGTGIRRCRPL